MALDLDAYPKSVSRELRAIRKLKIVKLECKDKLCGRYYLSAKSHKLLVDGLQKCMDTFEKKKKATIAQDVRNLINSVRNGHNIGLPEVSKSDKIEGKG